MSRFTLLSRFFCVPAKRQHSVMMNAIKAVIVGKMLFRSIMVGERSMRMLIRIEADINCPKDMRLDTNWQSSSRMDDWLSGLLQPNTAA